MKEQYALFNWSIKFQIETKQLDEDGNPIKRTGVATCMAVSAEKAALAFNDMTKKDKSWKLHKVLVTELPKLIVHNIEIKPVNSKSDGKKTVE